MRNKCLHEISDIILDDEIDEYRELREILALMKMLGIESLAFEILAHGERKSSILLGIEDDAVVVLGRFWLSSYKSESYSIDYIVKMIYNIIQYGDFIVDRDCIRIRIDVC